MVSTLNVLAIALLVAMLIIDRLARQRSAPAVAVQTVPATAGDFSKGGRPMNTMSVLAMNNDSDARGERQDSYR